MTHEANAHGGALANAHGGALTAAQGATLIDTLVAADLRLADELDRIEGSRSPVSDETVRRLEDLLRTALRPGAAARSVLSEMAQAQPEVFRAAVGLRLRRRHDAGGQ